MPGKGRRERLAMREDGADKLLGGPQEEMLENFVASRAVFGMSFTFHILFASW